MASPLKVERLDHVSLIVRDVDASAKWYMELLGLEPCHVDAWWKGPGRFVGAGGTMIALFPSKDGAPPNPVHQGSFGCHVAFRVPRETFEAYQKLLTERHIAFEWLDHAIAHSMYFNDPDGYTLEITTYEVPAVKKP